MLEVEIYLELFLWIGRDCAELLNFTREDWRQCFDQFCQQRLDSDAQLQGLFRVPADLSGSVESVTLELRNSLKNAKFQPERALSIAQKLDALYKFIVNYPEKATALLNQRANWLASELPHHPYHYWVHKILGMQAYPQCQPLYLFSMLDPHNRQALCSLLDDPAEPWKMK